MNPLWREIVPKVSEDAKPGRKALPPEPIRIRDLQIEAVPISALRHYARNPRTHSKKQLRQIADSIRSFGWLNPILIDATGGLIAGHGRLEAARLLGIERVPTIRIEGMTEAQKRAYVIADNRLAELAGWDREILAIEIQTLSSLDIDFDLEITGFETPEIDLLIEGLGDDTEDNETDSLPPIERDRAPVTRRGDLWLLESHRLACGDATVAEDYGNLLAGEQAQMVFADPPYNVRVDGHVCGLGSIKHSEFAMASGEMSADEFTSFLETTFGHLVSNSADGSVHFICMDWRHLYEALSAGRGAYTELKNLCVWNKSNGGMGSLYRSKHELILVFKNGKAPHINNVELGRHGRYRSNVWNYPGVNAMGPDRQARLAMHPTVKPVALIADAIRDCSRRNGLILDPFAGSGTTLIAAEKAGRRCAAMELEPRYVDLAIARWQTLTGRYAVRADSGITFAAAREQRDAGRTGPSNIMTGAVDDQGL